LTLKLFPRGDDTLANGGGDLLTEQPNRRGCYRAIVDEPLEGLHEAYVVDGDGNLIFTGVVELAADGSVYTVGELGDVPVSTRASATVAESILAAVQGIATAVASVATAIAAVPAAVWSYSVRVLTASAVSSSSVEQDGSELVLHRGDTLAISFTDLGSLVGRQKLWFTLKSKRADADSAAQLLAEETEGLLVLAGAVPVAAETATISVKDADSGTVTIAIYAAASQKLQPTTTGVWDLQVRDPSGAVRTLVHGALTITADVTQRIE